MSYCIFLALSIIIYHKSLSVDTYWPCSLASSSPPTKLVVDLAQRFNESVRDILLLKIHIFYDTDPIINATTWVNMKYLCCPIGKYNKNHVNAWKEERLEVDQLTRRKPLWLYRDAKGNELTLWERHIASHYYLHPSLSQCKHFNLLKAGQVTLWWYNERCITTGIIVREENLPLGTVWLEAHTNVIIGLLQPGEVQKTLSYTRTTRDTKWTLAALERGIGQLRKLQPHSHHKACLILAWTRKLTLPTLTLDHHLRKSQVKKQQFSATQRKARRWRETSYFV